MKDNYDFTGAIKNPFAGREKGKFVVKINYDPDKKQNIIKDRKARKTQTTESPATG